MADSTSDQKPAAEKPVVEKPAAEHSEDVKPATTGDGGETNQKDDTKDRYQTEKWSDLRDKDKRTDGKHSDRRSRHRDDRDDRDRSRDRDDRRRHRSRSPRGRGGGRGTGRGSGRGRGRGSARGGARGGARNGPRTQPNLPETDDPDEIRKQVEFYFSDANIYTDKHLLTQINGHENKPFPLKELHTFSRMRRFQPYTAIVAALKESDELNIIENGTAGEEAVQRKHALPEGTSLDVDANRNAVDDQTMHLSIYAKGFGDEKDKYKTQTEIERFFEPYGPISSVRLRREQTRGHFKGSVFVQFATEEAQQAFLNLDSKPQWRGKHLKIQSKKDYLDTKNKMLEEDRASGSKRPRDDDEEDRDDVKKAKTEEDARKGTNGEANGAAGAGGKAHAEVKAEQTKEAVEEHAGDKTEPTEAVME